MLFSKTWIKTIQFIYLTIKIISTCRLSHFCWFGLALYISILLIGDIVVTTDGSNCRHNRHLSLALWHFIHMSLFKSFWQMMGGEDVHAYYTLPPSISFSFEQRQPAWDKTKWQISFILTISKQRNTKWLCTTRCFLLLSKEIITNIWQNLCLLLINHIFASYICFRIII